jgi:uncharacterized protein with GYD domain
MATYLMFGNYSIDAIKEISAKRTEKAHALIEKYGGKVVAGYALLGKTDLVLVIEFENNTQAMKTSVALSRLLGISFTTAPALSFEAFDALMDDL